MILFLILYSVVSKERHQPKMQLQNLKGRRIISPVTISQQYAPAFTDLFLPPDTTLNTFCKRNKTTLQKLTLQSLKQSSAGSFSPKPTFIIHKDPVGFLQGLSNLLLHMYTKYD